MITKELLSEVLGKSVVGDIESPFPEYIYYDWDFKDNTMRINIYELAHKCKEWAWNIDNKNRYKIESSYIESTNYKKKSLVQILHGDDLFWKQFTSDTEPEAIFKACQWILDSKGK